MKPKRHHNNKGHRQIRRGKTYRQERALMAAAIMLSIAAGIGVIAIVLSLLNPLLN